MRYFLFCVLVLLSSAAAGQLKVEKLDRYGNVLQDAGHLEVRKDGSVVNVDKYGNRTWSDGSYRVSGDGRVKLDRYGNKVSAAKSAKK